MPADETKPTSFTSPLATVALTLGIYFGSLLAAGLLISLPVVFGVISSTRMNVLLTENVWVMFVFVAAVEALAIWLTYAFLKLRRQGFRDIGFDQPKAQYIVYAVAGFAMYFLFYLMTVILAKALVPSLDLNQEQEIGFSKTASGMSLLPAFVSLVVLPPLVEEIVARGFLFGGLRRHLQFIPAAIITSILFAAAHLGEASEGLLWVGALDTFILSIVLCYLREKTGSLWPSIGLHALKNGLAFIILFNILAKIG